KRFGAREGAPLIRLGAIRETAGGASGLCWSNIYVPTSFAALGDHLGRDATPVYQIIEREFDVRAASVRLDIEACAIANPIARHLEIAYGTPGLKVTRTYADAKERVFEVSVSLHPADRFTYSFTFDKLAQGADTRPQASNGAGAAADMI
ncbi:MAG: UTRA domain-containing protein, partial [Pseudomonadota bacterium]